MSAARCEGGRHLTPRRDSPTILPQRPSSAGARHETSVPRIPPVRPSSLTVSIVTYRPDHALLARCVARLAAAIAAARAEGVLANVAVALIDNSGDREIASRVIELGNASLRNLDVRLTYLHGHANIGYGAAHNLALHGTGTDFHLVLNPDIELAADALVVALRWLDAHPDFGAVVPAVINPDGGAEYLCKRYPAVIDLALRGFAPPFLRARFRSRLARYEMRDRIDPAAGEPVLDIPLMSGACMLVRRAAIEATGGFDPRFFLYFEDYDWSVRLNAVTRTAYLPAMRVVHHGGRAARKGMRHVGWFARSGARFYRKHGWRWI
jgi:GT2 family glycosyltransferase